MTDDVATPSNPPVAPVEQEELEEALLDMIVYQQSREEAPLDVIVYQQPHEEEPPRRVVHTRVNHSAWDR